MLYTLKTELRGPLYRDVLDWGAGRCGSALMVVLDSAPLSDEGSKLLERLEPYLIERKPSSKWPGTELDGDVALVHRYNLPDCIELLKNATDHLYGWLQPDLPEDLSLLTRSGEEYLTTISHEEDSYFTLSDLELHALLKAIPEIEALLSPDE
jgi:hypothetical protein